MKGQGKVAAKDISVKFGKDEVRIQTSDGQLVWKGAGFAITASARDENGENWRLRVQFIDRDGRVQKRLIAPAVYRAPLPKFAEFFESSGYQFPDDQKLISALRQAVISASPESRERITYRHGWHGDIYVTRNGAIGMNSDHETIVAEGRADIDPARFEKQGSLRDWIQNVAVPSGSSSRLMLAICSALSGPLLRVASVESGGMHCHGTSSTGKSTSLSVFIGVFGSPEYRRVWAVTEAGFAELCAGHSDTGLGLDELQELETDSRVAPNIIRKLTYLLTGGAAKKRSGLYNSAAGLTWCTAVFSNGEKSLDEVSASVGKRRMDGERVRFVDIPADAGCGHGIFETLPQGYEFGSLASEAISAAAAKYYGTAGDAMISRIVSMLKQDRQALEKLVSKRLRSFIKAAEVDRANGREARMAKRFAIAYAAGALAADWGIVPWERKSIKEAVLGCYIAARGVTQGEQVATADDAMKVILRKVAKAERFVDLTTENDNLATASDRPRGYVIRDRSGKRRVLVKKSVMERWVPDIPSRKLAVRRLINEKILVAGREGVHTRQVKVRGIEGRKRYYVFRKKKIDAVRKRAS